MANMNTIKASYTLGTGQTFVDGDVSVANDTIVIDNHGYNTGDVISLTNAGGALPGGTAVNTAYYVIQVDASTISLATSRANAFLGTVVNITTAAGGGTHTATENAMGTVLTGTIIPINSCVVNAVMDVITAVTSDGALEMAIGTGEAANDLRTAAVVAGAPVINAVNELLLIPDFATAGDWVTVTADREVIFTITVAAATAGDIDVYLTYLNTNIT